MLQMQQQLQKFIRGIYKTKMTTLIDSGQTNPRPNSLQTMVFPDMVKMDITKTKIQVSLKVI
jgi:hypothetical protein